MVTLYPDQAGAHQAATQGQDKDEATVSRAKPRHHGSLDFKGSTLGWEYLIIIIITTIITIIINIIGVIYI